MWRIALGGFVLVHGFVTAMVWTAPKPDDAPFDARHSWLLGDATRLAKVLAWVSALGFAVAVQ